MAGNRPQRRVIRDAAELDALLEQLKRRENPNQKPKAKRPEIKKPCLPSSHHQPQAPVIDAQTSPPINAIVISKEVRDIASHAAEQTSNAINANESNNHSALATAIAALREA